MTSRRRKYRGGKLLSVTERDKSDSKNESPHAERRHSLYTVLPTFLESKTHLDRSRRCFSSQPRARASFSALDTRSLNQEIPTPTPWPGARGLTREPSCSTAATRSLDIGDGFKSSTHPLRRPCMLLILSDGKNLTNFPVSRSAVRSCPTDGNK